MDNQLGTYTTFDAPTQKQDEALEFLQNEFSAIDGRVWKKSNAHDFGSYPSFEIDYPEKLELLDEDSEDEDDKNLVIEKDNWHNKADDIAEKYNKKFADYL